MADGRKKKFEVSKTAKRSGSKEKCPAKARHFGYRS